jgi:uncharacterized coiled-coil protein SlyX
MTDQRIDRLRARIAHLETRVTKWQQIAADRHDRIVDLHARLAAQEDTHDRQM